MRNQIPKTDAPHVPLIRMNNLLWMPLLVAGWLAVEFYGTPHLLITYSYRPIGAARFYLSCDYWGLHSLNLKPVDGKCPRLLFARAGGDY